MSRAREAFAQHLATIEDGTHLLMQLPVRDVPSRSGLSMEIDVLPHLTNPRGGLQGGLIATVADMVAGRILLDALPEGSMCATVDLSVHYLTSLDAPVARFDGRIARMGGRLAVIQVDVFNEGSDALAAICTLTFSLTRAG